MVRTIEPLSNNGSILLKVMIDGTLYKVSPGGRYDDPIAIAKARAIGLQMAIDIEAKDFDRTLERYRPHKAKPSPRKPKTLLELWDVWTSTLDTSPQNLGEVYKSLRNHIAKASPNLEDVQWFTKLPWAPRTFNHRLGFLRSCLRWAVRKGLASDNPWEDLRPRKVPMNPVVPFSPDELQAILKALGERSPKYIPLVVCLMTTGLRVSEALGLTWDKIDLTKGTLRVNEQTPRDRAGTGALTLRKATKGNTDRILDLPEALKAVLGSPRAGLVFHIEGRAIQYPAIQKEWPKTLKKAGVPYRSLHKLRHTVLSMAIEEGTPITGVAYLAGHRDTTMVVRTYGHMLNRPKLPLVLPIEKTLSEP